MIGRFDTCVALLCLALMMAGCVATGPRFPTEVQQSFADEDMRRMETPHLQVYYPEGRRQEARQIATRLEQCLADLEALTPQSTDWGLVPVFLPEVEFNNAYVAFGPGEDPHIVVPTFFTGNIFGQLGYTPSASAVGCHEMVHYVHLTQIHSVFGVINDLFGPSINPQMGLDLWFFEGLATYYESQLVEGVGRYGSPIWDNAFAAGLASTDLDSGKLSEWNRAIPYGAHYLVGSYFVAHLAGEYGEEKLWRLVHQQGSSVLFPFAVSLRFRSVYGKTLGELIDEFIASTERDFAARHRPDEQTRHRWAGQRAMLETGPQGHTALFSQDVDAVAAIEIFDEQGERLLRRRIPDVRPPRRLVAARHLEAMRFGPDAEALYFLAQHQGRSAPRTSLMRLDIADDRLRTVRDDIGAVGWDLSADGNRYVVATADGNRVQFHRHELDDPERREKLFELPDGAYVGWVRLSPDGTRLAATVMEGDQWSVAVFELDGTLVGKWSTGESHRPAFDPRWLDDDRLLFVASHNRRIQIFEGHLDGGEVLRHSDVPYMAFNPGPRGEQGLQFLNRDGWGWSLDHLDRRAKEPTEQVTFHRGAGPDATEVAGYSPSPQPALVIDDHPYSTLDGLFTPRLRIPSIAVVDGDEFYASLGLSGRDELGMHNWAVDAQWDFAQERLSGSFAYVNTQLSPWHWRLQLANRWSTTFVPIDGASAEDSLRAQRDRFASFQLSRPVYDIPIQLEFLAVDFFREAEDEDADDDVRRLLGPEIGTRYAAGRTTSYGGTQWLLALSGTAGAFPAQIGSDFSMGHLRSQLEIHTPLPFSDLHRLRLSGRVRALPGVPDDEALMRVGGFGAYSDLFVSGDAEDEPMDSELLPRGFLFSESLRGYEDLGLVTNRVAIGDLNYRHPLIIDRGTASSLTVMPAVFVREFGLEAFGSAATFWDDDLRAAVGASTDLSMIIWRVPLQIRYQVAQRLFDDERLVHTIMLGAGF